MRFTPAFVSSLSSVSAVLAISTPPSNVAGVRVTKTNANFSIVSGTFVVPHIQCLGGDSIAYAGFAIDDPSNCPGSLEAGVALICEDGEPSYQAYWQYFPDLEYYLPNLTISEGNEIHIETTRPSTGIELVVDNMSDFDSTGVLNPGWGPKLCGDSVSWTLRGNIILDVLQEIPKFNPIMLYRLGATDQAGTHYKPQQGQWEVLNIGYNWTSVSIGGPDSEGDSFNITWQS